MKQAFDLTEVRLLLRRGIAAGHWTLEQLDLPSPGWVITMEDARRIPGFVPPAYRNLLRDEPTPAERVQVTDPRDFALAPAAADPVQRGSAPLPMATNGSVVESFSDAGVQGEEGRMGDAKDHGDQAHLGTTWEGGASSTGDLSDDW